METTILDNNSILAIVGSIITFLMVIIGYFLNREFKQTDSIKDSLISIDKKIAISDEILNNITDSIESINEKFNDINEKFDAINEKFDSVNTKLQAIDKDSSTTKHELEMISNMIKPLFEMKESVDKTNQAISELFKRSDSQKDALHSIYERLNSLEKNQK